MFATMYCFSRAGYLAVVLGIFLLGLLKNRKFLILVFVFLFTWQAVVPTAVRERVNMTEDANGNLEASAEERVLLWTEARDTFLSDPIFGVGYSTFALRYHIDNLRDTHNWYVKILVETGLVGMLIALVLLLQMLALAWRLFRRAEDPLYRGLGLGLFLCGCCSIALNFFGDRWTYIEITGLLWVLLAAAARAANLDPGTEKKVDALAPPYAQMAYR